MRHSSIIVLLISFFTIISATPSYSAIKGKLEYFIPTDYSKINEDEFELKAKDYFFLAEKLEDGKINEDMTNALFLYGVLENINPEKIEYSVKLGILYDKINKDRQAKGKFSKAININSSDPLPYLHFGNFYYKRKLYRKALKYYNESYKLGFNSNYDLLYKMGDIYEKLGDSRSALKYLQEAEQQSPNPDLANKIKQVQMQDSINKEYYSNTKIKM